MAPQLPPSGRSQNAVTGNQVYQARPWATQEQWSSDPASSLEWFDTGSLSQGRQFDYDITALTAPVATSGPSMNASMEDRFSNYGFVDPSASQSFGRTSNLDWSNMKMPLCVPNLWQGSTLAMSKWSNALNPPTNSEKSPDLSQWISPPFGQMEGPEGDQMEDNPAIKNKKIKRMLSNRASAKRSRQRRQERLDELEIQSAKLHVEHASMTRKLKDALEASRRYQDENSRLKREIDLLKSQLDPSDSKRLKVSSSSLSNDIVEFPETKLEDSSKSATSSHSLASHPVDFGSDVEVKQEFHGIPLGENGLGISLSPFSPDSGVTGTHDTSAPLNDLAFPINSDAVGPEFDCLEDDWFADIVDCFDQKSLVP